MTMRLVEDGAVVGGEGAPLGDGRVPRGTLRGVAAASDVLERGVVRGDQTGARAALDAHVADRHPLFHVQGADRLAAVLEHVTGAAADADPGDQGEDDVLRTDAGVEAAVDAHLVGLRLALEQRLGREDHLDLAGPDPERERPERPVGRRVGVAADDGHAGLRQAELRADDVDDALGVAAEGMDRDAEVRAVGLELLDLGRRLHVDHREAARRGGGAVVRGGDGLVRATHLRAPVAEPGEGLGAGDLMDEVEVDGEDGRGTRVLRDDVLVPDLLDEGSRLGHGGGCSAASGRGGKGTSAQRPDAQRAPPSAGPGQRSGRDDGSAQRSAAEPVTACRPARPTPGRTGHGASPVSEERPRVGGVGEAQLRAKPRRLAWSACAGRSAGG